jgi:tryptophan synthase beta chain
MRQSTVPVLKPITLPPDSLPKFWYNPLPDLPEELPRPMEPSGGPSRLEAVQKVSIKECLKQDYSDERWIPIPEGIRELYIHAGRPRPLYRAERLEHHLGLKHVRLYYKREDLSPTGSHKVNTALAQAYYAAKQGCEGLVTETGAGQWGTALAYACSLLGLECVIFWVRAVHRWKKERRGLMKLYGAKVHASPSKITRVGREELRRDPAAPGSLAIAVSEGLEYAADHEGYAYALGSVLNHVLIHQTIIGLEAREQLQSIGEKPDLVVACLGGGSNFGGICLPFIGDVLKKRYECEFLAAQSEAAPNLIAGVYRYDFADAAGYTPLLKMYTLGHQANLKPIWSDGIRYHAAAPIISLLRHKGIINAVAYPADEAAVFQAAELFLRTEGWLIAGESAHAVKAAIDKALQFEEKQERKVILVNISGHGFLDLRAYQKKLTKAR